MLADSLTGVIRTAVPAFVGWVIALLLARGISVTPEAAEQVSTALIPVCIAAYYALVTVLERKVSPEFGWLLGSPKAPTYGPNDAPAVAARESE